MESHRVYKLLLRTHTMTAVDGQQNLTQWDFSGFCLIMPFRIFFNLHIFCIWLWILVLCFCIYVFHVCSLWLFFIIYLFVLYYSSLFLFDPNLTLFYYYFFKYVFFKDREKMWIWIGDSGSLTDLWDFIRLQNLYF